MTASRTQEKTSKPFARFRPSSVSTRTAARRAPLLLAAFLALPAACDGPGQPRVGPDAPNVLFLCVDTLRADHLGFYGYDRPTSPRMDAFAAESVVFDAAQASSSWTLPGLASVLTSQYTSTHHCWSFASRLDESFTTLTELLLAVGYDTACVTSHVFVTTRHGLQQGFVHFDDSYAYPPVDPEDSVTSHIISDKGIRFLRQKAAAKDTDPWFLWLHYFDPHDTYVEHEGISEEFVTPGERSNDVISRDRYDGEIRYTDVHVGRVLDALRETGLDENTIVVLFSDHGEEFLDHGAQGHGHTLHRELVRVPLAIRAPGIAARRVEQTVRTVDILPTILDLVGLPPRADAAGKSLANALRGAAFTPHPALAEIAPHGKPPVDCVIDDRYKLIRTLDDPPRYELYDLQQDPGETRDLAGELPDVLERLKHRLTNFKTDALERAKGYGSAREVELTPGLVDTLKGLGYL